MTLIISVALCIAVLEVSFRVHHMVYKDEILPPLISDKTTDWRPRNGFQVLPKSIDPTKKTLLVIGDSYTQASHVEKGEAYYDYLSDRYNLFAFGASGFGTYQEFLTLKLHFTKIKPDLVLLQFCSNDFINNSFILTELDRHNRTNFDRRFWLDGQELKHSDLSFVRKLYGWVSWLRISGFVVGHYQKFQSGRYPEKIEAQIARNSIDQEMLKKEVGHTAQNLHKIVELVGVEKLRIFNVSKPGPLLEIYKQQADALKIKRLDSAVDAVYKYGDVYAADGAHFNKMGHKVLGESLKRLMLE